MSNALSLLIFSLLTLSATLATANPSGNDVSDAEQVAYEYIMAFYRGDGMAAAKTVHPATLEKDAASTLAKLDEAKTTGTTKELLEQFNFNVGKSGDIIRF